MTQYTGNQEYKRRANHELQGGGILKFGSFRSRSIKNGINTA
jgi:hypothetical protein